VPFLAFGGHPAAVEQQALAITLALDDRDPLEGGMLLGDHPTGQAVAHAIENLIDPWGAGIAGSGDRGGAHAPGPDDGDLAKRPEVTPVGAGDQTWGCRSRQALGPAATIRTGLDHSSWKRCAMARKVSTSMRKALTTVGSKWLPLPASIIDTARSWEKGSL